MNMYSCVILACMVTVSSSAVVWQNDYDKLLSFKCPDGQKISRVQSIHSNGAEDRRFAFECSDIGVDTGGLTPSCSWTSNYVNNYDQPVIFECASNHFLSGMESVHSNSAEDRRWKFYCCSYSTVHLIDCDLTGFTNDYDQPQDYHLPTGKVIKGVESIHDNGAEDRRFEYDICNIFTGDNSIVG